MAFDPDRVRAICFDVDGTLRDTDDQWVAALARRLRVLHGVLPGGDERRVARRLIMRLEGPGTALNSLADSLGLDGWLARVADRPPDPRQAAQMRLIPGVPEMLVELSGRYPLAIVSARGRRATLGFLEAFGLAAVFQAIATGQTCARTKPHPDPLIWAAQRLGVPPEACLMVGDTTVDIRAGRAAGAQTIGVLCGFGEQDELLRAGADVILAATPALAAFLPRR